MHLLRPPGVYAPQSDTWLLARALRLASPRPGARVLDVCTGTGALALAAARAGAGGVTAVDLSRRAVLAARFNAAVRRLPVRVVRGDLTRPVAGEASDVILANPPYVPAPGRPLPGGGAALAWDAGADGRALLDRLCAAAPGRLAPGGMLLLVHSALCGTEWTLALLRGAGLKAAELAAMRSALDSDDVIADATSADDVSAGKPAPDLVEQALDRAGVPAHRAVFVGDTVWDVLAAGKAGVPCVALLSGGIPRAALEGAGAAAVYRDPRDLLRAIDGSPLRA